MRQLTIYTLMAEDEEELEHEPGWEHPPLPPTSNQAWEQWQYRAGVFAHRARCQPPGKQVNVQFNAPPTGDHILDSATRELRTLTGLQAWVVHARARDIIEQAGKDYWSAQCDRVNRAQETSPAAVNQAYEILCWVLSTDASASYRRTHRKGPRDTRSDS